jgi:acyl dehydratase
MVAIPLLPIHHLKRFVNTKAFVVKTITQKEVDAFAQLTNDHNPIHKVIDSKSSPIVHGAFLNGLVAGVIGTQMPGPGTVVVSQTFSFPHKCVVDKEIEILVELIEQRKIMKVSYECKQDGKIVFTGTAKLVSV